MSSSTHAGPNQVSREERKTPHCEFGGWVLYQHTQPRCRRREGTGRQNCRFIFPPQSGRAVCEERSWTGRVSTPDPVAMSSSIPMVFPQRSICFHDGAPSPAFRGSFNWKRGSEESQAAHWCFSCLNPKYVNNLFRIVSKETYQELRTLLGKIPFAFLKAVLASV